MYIICTWRPKPVKRLQVPFLLERKQGLRSCPSDHMFKWHLRRVTSRHKHKRSPFLEVALPKTSPSFCQLKPFICIARMGGESGLHPPDAASLADAPCHQPPPSRLWCPSHFGPSRPNTSGSPAPGWSAGWLSNPGAHGTPAHLPPAMLGRAIALEPNQK